MALGWAIIKQGAAERTLVRPCSCNILSGNYVCLTQEERVFQTHRLASQENGAGSLHWKDVTRERRSPSRVAVLCGRPRLWRGRSRRLCDA